MSFVRLRPAPRCLAVLAAVLLVTACQTLRVGTDHDPSADFSRYHRFVWMPPHTRPFESSSPLIVQRTHDAIESALTAKGYALADDPSAADFVVDFTIGSRERADVRSYPTPYGGPWMRGGGYWWGAPYWGSELDVHQYREGTISVDIFDARTHRPVWHGWARKELTRADIEHSASSIRQAIDAILAGFPPK